MLPFSLIIASDSSTLAGNLCLPFSVLPHSSLCKGQSSERNASLRVTSHLAQPPCVPVPFLPPLVSRGSSSCLGPAASGPAPLLPPAQDFSVLSRWSLCPLLASSPSAPDHPQLSPIRSKTFPWPLSSSPHISATITSPFKKSSAAPVGLLPNSGNCSCGVTVVITEEPGGHSVACLSLALTHIDTALASPCSS